MKSMQRKPLPDAEGYWVRVFANGDTPDLKLVILSDSIRPVVWLGWDWRTGRNQFLGCDEYKADGYWLGPLDIEIPEHARLHWVGDRT